MKRWFIGGLAFLMAGTVEAEMSLMDRAQRLFPENMVMRYNPIELDVLLKNLESHRKESCATFTNEIEQVMQLAISSIISFQVNVSTNLVDDGTSARQVSKKRDLAYKVTSRLFEYWPSTNACLQIARHLGTIRKADFNFSFELTPYMGGIDGYMTEEERQALVERRNRIYQSPEFRLQQRIWDVNHAIDCYHSDLLFVCDKAMKALRQKLTPVEYQSFTNEFFRLTR